MFSPAKGALRLTRALGLAVAAYALSLVAHLVGGGLAPSALGTAILLGVTWWACVMVTSRRLGRPALIGLLAASQVLLHAGLDLAGSTGGCMTVSHAHADHLAKGTMTVCSTMAGPAAPMHQGGGGLLMTLAHACAAVLLGLVLARGEAALWFLAALVWPRAPRPVVLPAPTRRVQVAVAGTLFVRVLLVPGGVGRRGPPSGCALVAR